LLAAWPAAGALLALLIAAQVLFPPKTFQASTPALAETIDLTAAADMQPDNAEDLSPSAQPHVVNRVSKDDRTQDDEAAQTENVVSAVGDVAASTASTRDDESSADKPSPSEEAPALTREVKFLNGKVRIDTYKEAVLGSPDAKYVVVELMDYTCPHCRKMHAHVREALDRYGDQLAVVIMPVPLELECNKMVPATDPMHRGACKMAKLALAVAQIDPVKFHDFHDFLLADEEKAPTAGQAVARAFRLVNRRELSELTNSESIEGRIQKYIKLYASLSAEHKGKDTKSFGLPAQIVGDTVLSGGEVTAEEMFEAWEKALGIKPL
jgi:protein-disulfide isomerase